MGAISDFCGSGSLPSVYILSVTKCGSRETKEGRPLLPDETEVNGDSKRTNDRGPS